MKKSKKTKNQKDQVSVNTQATTFQPESKPNFRKYYYILGILVFFIFANSLNNGYNMDDELVTRNHKLTSRGMEAVKDIFTSPYYSDDMGYAYGYRPIVHLSFALEHELFGEKPRVSHFINVLLYGLSVILFFKLLLKWTGEKGLVLAIVAAVIFAVHPVHTEVVDSIKNRDEILTFLFVICAGLAMEKYLSKDRMISLLWIFVFFSIAMLSKKSVFPLAVILPVVSIFLKQITVRQLCFVSAATLIPAAAIGSDLEIMRLLLIFGAGVLLIGIAFLVKSQGEKLKAILTDYRLVSAISLTVMTYGIWNQQVMFYFIAAIFQIIFYRSNKRAIVLIFFAEGLIAFFFSLTFGASEIAVLNMIVASYLVFEQMIQKKFDWTMIAVTVIFMGAFAYIDIKGLYLSVVIFAFTFLIQKKWIIGAACAAVLAGLQLAFSDISLPFALLLVIAGFQAIHVFWGKFEIFPWMTVAGIVVAFIFLPSDLKQNTAETKMSIAISTKNESSEKSILKEGRDLEPIENTLVLPHTQNELLATGLATLGEYMRLMFFPAELSFYYGYAKTKTVGLNNPWVWTSIIIHLLLIVLALWQLKKRTLLSLGIIWYLLCILLFSNWVELVAGMVGERLAFVASAGFCIFIASVALWIRPGFSFSKPGAVELVLGLIVVVLSVRTIVRNADWKNPMTLMSNDIQHLQVSAQANNLYALKLMESSMTDVDVTLEVNQERQRQAIKHFDKALEIWPAFFNAAYDKGRAGIASGDTLAAIDGFEKAVTIGSNSFTDPYYQLGELYLAKKRNKDFLSVGKSLYKLNADKSDTYNFLARGYFINGYLDSARQVLNAGISRFPSDANLKKNLEMVK